MNKTGAWIKAMRLRTLPLSFSVIIVGNALAYSHSVYVDCGDTLHAFNWEIFSWTLVTTLLLQILSNFANDYGDAVKGADNESRIGPSRTIQSGLLSQREMLRGILVTAAMALVAGIYLLSISLKEFDALFITFLGLGIAAIVGAITYTVGKMAYGYKGLGDLFVFVFFGLLGVYGSYYLHFQEFYLPTLIFAVIMGCFCTAVLNLNNMRDRENDALVGKITFAVRLGFKGSKIYHYILFATAWTPIILIIVPQLAQEWRTALFMLPVLLIHIVHIIKVIRVRNPADFDPELKKVALSAFLFSILFFLSIYLDV